MKLSIGPGALVAAAFIGPGTVTACTVAGASFGFALIWTLVFATFATIILQCMAARLGVGARLGLGEALMRTAGSPILKGVLAVLILAALGLGNAAYEAGNLTGGALGIDAIIGDNGPSQTKNIVLVLSLLAAAVLLLGGYKIVEKLLIGLVLIMALSFTVSAILVRPDIESMLSGLIPSVPEGGLLTAIALIGTTIVPYNLFLHAAAARKRWKESDEETVATAVADTGLSIGLGGLISILVLSTAAASLFGQSAEISSATDMAAAIEPTYGEFAKYLVGIGLFAAGLTSSITAPMATGYALTEILNRHEGRAHDLIYRTTALVILLIGTGVAVFSNQKPVNVILIAQIANGILLPIIACALLYAMNRKDLLGAHVNGRLSNIFGTLVVLVTLFLGVRLILRAIGVWP